MRIFLGQAKKKKASEIESFFDTFDVAFFSRMARARNKKSDYKEDERVKQVFLLHVMIYWLIIRVSWVEKPGRLVML